MPVYREELNAVIYFRPRLQSGEEVELIQTYKVGPILDQQSMVSFCPPMLLPQPVRIAARPHESHSRNKHRKTMFCWCPAKPKVVFEHQVLVDRKPDARSRTIVWFFKGLDPDVGLKSRILDSRDQYFAADSSNRSDRQGARDHLVRQRYNSNLPTRASVAAS